MPSPLEPFLMRKFSIKYAEARKLSFDGRKNLDMDKFEPWTPELEAECSRIFNARWATLQEKVEPCSPPTTPSNSKDTNFGPESTESDVEHEDPEFPVPDREICTIAAILPSADTQEPDKRSPRNLQDTRSSDSVMHFFKEPGQKTCNVAAIPPKRAPSILQDARSPDSVFNFFQVPDQEIYNVAAIPSTDTQDPDMRTDTQEPDKRTTSNLQDAQSPDSAAHSFLENLFGDRLVNCNLIVDNAKMAPHRAIDFEALALERKRARQEEKQRRRQRAGRRRTHIPPLADRFAFSPPVTPKERKSFKKETAELLLQAFSPPCSPKSRKSLPKQSSVVLLQDFETKFDTCEKHGSSGAPKAPQRRDSVDDDDAFWTDVKRVQNDVRQKKTEV
jgi:hypothetical protein